MAKKPSSAEIAETLRRSIAHREIFRSKDLIPGQVYSIASLRLVNTQYGTKVVGVLNGQYDYYLPNRLQEILVPICSSDCDLPDPIRFRFVRMNRFGQTEYPVFELLSDEDETQMVENNMLERVLETLDDSQKY